tara:strand:- start:487 stop:1287 length:801 start_codon:yes stop_codon:yes gene_type:complete
MSFINKNPEIIKEVVEISKKASRSILEIYEEELSEYEIKSDSTPLTQADISSHRIIDKGLKKITPEIPILSEEGSNIPFEVRSNWGEYWLIDPLDGTKEFIKRNGEFTVNIALIRNNKPIFGVINIPVENQIYWGAKGLGSYVIDNDKEPRKIQVNTRNNKKIRILTSRSHAVNENLILKKLENYEIVRAGSSLKFCLIASGIADIYPRFGPTSEWDIAAGHAILESAGGIIVDMNKKQIEYNKKASYINNNFIACSTPQLFDLIN